MGKRTPKTKIGRGTTVASGAGIHWLAVGIASNCPVKCQGKIQKAPIPSTTNLARLHYHLGPGPDCCWILAAQTVAYPDWASSTLG
eukprot:scaffold112448_cov57-Attheya_sp.AAC.1